MKSSTGSEVSSQSVLFTARRKQNLILKAPNTVCGKAFLQVDVQNKSKGVFFPFMPYQNLNVLSGLYLKHSCHIKASHLMLDHLSDGCLSRLQCSCKVPSLSDVITFSHHSKTQQLNVSCDAGLGKLARLFIEMLQVISWLITTKLDKDQPMLPNLLFLQDLFCIGQDSFTELDIWGPRSALQKEDGFWSVIMA